MRRTGCARAAPWWQAVRGQRRGIPAQPQARCGVSVLSCSHLAQYLSNGDDGYCLVYGSESLFTKLDCIGDYDGDPGSGWDVCGEPRATRDRTLVRKPTVTSGNPDWSYTSSVEGCEWDVYAQDDWSHIGFHVIASPGDASPPSPPLSSMPPAPPSLGSPPPSPSSPPLPLTGAAPLFLSSYAEVRSRAD